MLKWKKNSAKEQVDHAPKTLEERLDAVEKTLLKPTKITWKDRLLSAWRNLAIDQYGTPSAYLFPLATGVFGYLTYLGISEGYEVGNMYEGLVKAGNLLDYVNAVQVPGVEVNFTPEIIEGVQTLTQESVAYEDCPRDIALFSHHLNETKEVWQNLQGEDLTNYIQETHKEVNRLIEEKPWFWSSIYATLGAISGLATVFGSIATGVGIAEGGFKWTDHNDWKKRLRKKFQQKFEEASPEILAHPYAREIVKFIENRVDHHKQREEGGEIAFIHELRSIDLLIERKDEKYKEVFREISRSADLSDTGLASLLKYIEKGIWEGNKAALQDYENFGLDKSKRIIQKDPVIAHLIAQGVSEDVAKRMNEFLVKNIDEKELFREYAMGENPDAQLFFNVAGFYEEFEGIPFEKRQKLARYLLKKGNRQYSSLLRRSHIEGIHRDRKDVLTYIAQLDEVPSVGVRGQLDTLVRFNSVCHSLVGDGVYSSYGILTFVNKLTRIATYQSPRMGEGAATVMQFLARHPNIKSGEAIEGLVEYFELAGKEDAFKSKWIKKEEVKLGIHTQPEGVLSKRGERKFLEELERRVALARYDKFRETIREGYLKPLTNILGTREKIPSNFIIDPELMSVLDAFPYFKDYRGGVMGNYLKDIVRWRVVDPPAAQENISRLAGNASLSDKLDSEKLDAWKKGFRHTYSARVDENLEKVLQEKKESEFKEFMRCVVELGYQVEENGEEREETIESAAEIYEVASTLDFSEEKAYLLEEAHHHLTNISKHIGEAKQSQQEVYFYDSNDPIESLMMGVVSGSCTNIRSGANSFAAVVNTLDDNKKVIYVQDSHGEKIGRTLAVLTSKGIVTYNKYQKNNLKTNKAWVDYFHRYAKSVGTTLIVPEHFVGPGLKEELGKRGAKKRTISTTLHKAVCDRWYDDRGVGRVKIPEEGYNMKFKAYVLK